MSWPRICACACSHDSDSCVSVVQGACVHIHTRTRTHASKHTRSTQGASMSPLGNVRGTPCVHSVCIENHASRVLRCIQGQKRTLSASKNAGASFSAVSSSVEALMMLPWCRYIWAVPRCGSGALGSRRAAWRGQQGQGRQGAGSAGGDSRRAAGSRQGEQARSLVGAARAGVSAAASSIFFGR